MNPIAVAVAIVVLGASLQCQGQLLTNLTALGQRLRVGDPSVRAMYSLDGPKGLATADLNGDHRPDLAVANTDGTVTLVYNDGEGRFGPAVHLQTGAQELRGIVLEDFNGDGGIDIAVAAPYASSIYLFLNQNGTFGTPVAVPSWEGARNLAVGDFNGDGRKDLVVAGTTNGLRELLGLGQGQFVAVTNLTRLGAFNPDFPKPYYAMATYRPAGAGRDELVATHADSSVVWVLGTLANGALVVRTELTNQHVYALAVGAVREAAQSGRNDLITASRDEGTVEVHPGIDTPARFQQAFSQRINVPGGPRAIALTDLDGDGWNDLVVVLRNFSRVLIYHNDHGQFVPTTETPVGVSPRELVAGDFDGDGRPDVAVMNRDSQDVSILLTFPGTTSFTTLDQIYPVDGEVTGLLLFDFNHDGRADVVQLHRASGEFSVRLAAPNGTLGAPAFYPMGALPTAETATDVNGDGITDLVTANLGRYGVEPGSISVRLGDGQGGFGPEERYFLPPEATGSLFALVAADFDRDGDVDLAAGFFDCRLAFFENTGKGKFKFTHSHRFVYESRVMVAGDFDGDGDIDLAGAGFAGDVVVLENKGDLLTTSELSRTDYPAHSSKKFGTRDIVAADVNNDGDLDLLVGSGEGTMLFLGEPGMGFFKVSDKLAGIGSAASALALADLDGDGVGELAVSCRVLSCINILKRDADGDFQPALTATVPSGDYLAAGDLDGDGRADLVGSGSVLWTALSSSRAQPVAAAVPRIVRPVQDGIRLNEVLAINTRLPLDQDGDRTSDWVELYNANPTGVALAGWTISLRSAGDGALTATNIYRFPPTALIAPSNYLVIIFSEVIRSLYHTGFRLPGVGGTLALMNADGLEVDKLTYGPQFENVSYGRYQDGLPALTFNPYPSPGRANADNGSVEPVARIVGMTPMPPRPDEPIRFFVEGRDDVGIVGLSLMWQRLDVPEAEPHRVVLYDDGEHEDGGVLDGRFSGLLGPGLPAGGEIQFYLEITGLGGLTVLEPNEPILSSRGRLGTRFTMAVGSPVPPLEISEVLAWNETGLRDERGFTPDWFEIRNCSTGPVSLQGVSVGSSQFGDGSRYFFPDSALLAPGEHALVFCDQNPEAGAGHAAFSLNRDGDRLSLASTSPDGARSFLDEVVFGSQSPDRSLARLGCGGPWHGGLPTPRQPNVPGRWLGLVDESSGVFLLAFPTTTNFTYVVEQTDSLGPEPPRWVSLPALSGDGVEKVVTQPLGAQRYYRVTKTP